MRHYRRVLLLGSVAALMVLACSGGKQDSESGPASGGVTVRSGGASSGAASGIGGETALNQGGVAPSLGGIAATASAGATTATGGRTSTCTPGDTRVCVGPGACAGGQLCSSDGNWLACDCGVTSGAGGAANGGTTNSGGKSPTTGGTATSGGVGLASGGTAAGGGVTNQAGATGVRAIACGKVDAAIPVTSNCIPSIAAFGQLPNVGLVLDKSGSMNTTPTGYATTKWAALNDAVAQILTERGESGLSLGLALFPWLDTGTVTSCELGYAANQLLVNIDSIAATGAKIKSVLSQTVPAGGTPTAAALSLVSDYFTKGSGAALRNEKDLILLTDGGANCNDSVVCGPETCTPNMEKAPATCGSSVPNCCDIAMWVSGRPNPQLLCLDDQSVASKLVALKDLGIKTYVVGIPGSEVYATYLDSFAVAGGTTVAAGTYKYYRVEASAGTAGIVAAFDAILKRVTSSCIIPLSSTLADPMGSELLVDCVLEPRQDSSGQPQWSYNGSAVNPSVTLLGSLCARVQANGVKRVDVVDVCPAN